MKTRMITYDFLRAKGACYEERTVFNDLFPQGVEVTEELAVRHAQVFNWEWAVGRLLDDPHSVREQERALAQSRHNAFLQARIQPWTIRAYKDAYDKVWAEYNLAAARLFATSFIAQGGRELLPDEPRPTSGGVELTDELLDSLAEEAERGFDIENLRPRRDRELKDTAQEEGSA